MRQGPATPHPSALGELHTAFGKLLHSTLDSVVPAALPAAAADGSGGGVVAPQAAMQAATAPRVRARRRSSGSGDYWARRP